MLIYNLSWTIFIILVTISAHFHVLLK